MNGLTPNRPMSSTDDGFTRRCRNVSVKRLADFATTYNLPHSKVKLAQQLNPDKKAAPIHQSRLQAKINEFSSAQHLEPQQS